MRRDSLPIPQGHLPRLALSVAICAASQGWAAPSGGVVQQGDAQISTGTHTQIHQTSQGAEISWDRFDIGANESVTFHVPNSQSYTLNHIHDFKPSEIYGNLSSNGTVILANPNGIYFGAGSSINVNAMVATTANVTLDGHQLTLTPSGQPGAIEHWGETTATQSLAFFAPRLEVGGVIDSANIELSNHSTGVVTLLDSGIGYLVNDEVADQLAQEGIRVSGELRAAGGYVGLSTSAMDSLANSALNMEGLVSVSSITEDAGQVVLKSDQGTAWINGSIQAGSSQGRGGDISIQGQQIAIVGSGQVSADGATGGGTIDIGSGVVGESERAEQVFLGQSTNLSASATVEGDGGVIDIWSTDRTQVYGSVKATGAGIEGQGGAIETSSEQTLLVDAQIDVSASNGQGGVWLLDPGDIRIVNAPNDNIIEDPTGVFNPDDPDVDSLVQIGSIINALNSLGNGGEVIVQTTVPDSNIFLETPFDLNLVNSTFSRLTLDASGSVLIYDDIINGQDKGFRLDLLAGNAIVFFGLTEPLEVQTLNLDASNVFSSGAVTIDALNVGVQHGLLWQAFSELTFSNNSNISSLTATPGTSLSFNMGTNNLTLGSVSQFGNRIDSLNITNTNTLTLTGNLQLGGTEALVLDSGINQLELASDSVLISTQGTEITLGAINGNGTNLNISNGLSSSNGINFSTMNNIGNLTVETGDQVRIDPGFITSDGIVFMDAGSIRPNGFVSFDVATSLTFNSDIEGGAANLFIDAGAGGINLLNVGSQSDPLNALALTTPGAIDIGNEVVTNFLDVDAASLGISSNTRLQANQSAQFMQTEITAPGSQVLTLIGTNSLSVADINVGGLSATSDAMQLSGDIVTGAGGIDLSQAGQITLADNVLLQSAGAGAIRLADNIGGGFGLTLNVQSGPLHLGTQTNATPLDYLIVNKGNPNAGQTTFTGDIHVENLFNLSQLGIFNYGGVGAFELSSANGDIRLNATTLNAQDEAVTITAANGIVTLGSLSQAESITIESQEMRLAGNLVASGALDFSAAGALNLIGNSQLTGQLNMGTMADNVAINGSFNLSINAHGSNLTLYEVGANQALNSLVVTQADTLRLTQNLNTQGAGGVRLEGNQWLLTDDALINTAGANGTINLAGITVNGPHTLTLNAGAGTVSLGNVGANGRLENLVLQQASSLQLGGDVYVDNERLDFSVVQAITLSEDTLIDTSLQDGQINLGNASIDGTFNLTLNSGGGDITMGAAGETIALQNFSLNTSSDLSLDRSINVVDQLTVNANQLSLSDRLASSGGTVIMVLDEGLVMTPDAMVSGYEGIEAGTTSGDMTVGFMSSEIGKIRIEATEGSILNGIGDFVNLKDTSVNLQASTVELIAGLGIGKEPTDPLVLDVDIEGVIRLGFTEPVAYIVNINGTQVAVTTDGQVFDVLFETLQATSKLSAQQEAVASPWRVALDNESMTQFPDTLLYAVTQPGFQIPSNVVLAGDAISTLVPDVPALRFDGRNWELRYPLRSID
ncbi:MAG: filamentous hemagglutinin N-terminal domain-containing protein [Saccharospirillum sp.]|nr:filamentous hemagglutinin N-terminal domain-containing protein [Saccharospirillum sp.]